MRKAALQIAVPGLLILMACNGYLAVRNLKRIRQSGAQTLEGSAIQADIAAVSQDLTDMESGQRGYLLTDDDEYLTPYNQAKARIGDDFAKLRLGLGSGPATRFQQERAIESKLESVAGSKQAEMALTIDLRQKGYRHRAFVMVAGNEGRDDMEQARRLLTSLSSMESRSFASFGQERNAVLKEAFSETILANLGLLLLTVALFALIRHHGRVLERDAAKSSRSLATREFQIEKITSVLSEQTSSQIAVIQRNARWLLEKFEDFLPRQGRKYAEEIEDAAKKLERLRKELVEAPEIEVERKAA